MPDNTVRKQNLSSFRPGQSGNPNCRPKGSRNKLSEAFIQALCEDFAAHGAATIARVREDSPAQYLKVIAGTVPRDMNVTVNPLGEMSDEELDQRIRELDEYISLTTGKSRTH